MQNWNLFIKFNMILKENPEENINHTLEYNDLLER